MAAESAGPLAGLKVIEIAGIGPVPFCGMLFADLGADIIRIDRIGASDLGVPLEPRFNIMGRGRRSIALDLKRPETVDIVLRLIAGSDALIEGLRPGVMERLGLGPDECMARNEKLVYGRMTGWGQDGPLAERAGHDMNYIAINGVLAAIGELGGPPVPPLNLAGDFGGGAMFLAFGVLAGVMSARATGKGQVVDAAMVDGSAYLMTTVHMLRAGGMWPAGRGGNILDGGAPFYRPYETKDGKYMAVGPIEAKFYAQLVEGLGLDAAELPGQFDPNNWDALGEKIADAFRTRTQAEWTAVFDGMDACVTPILTMEEAAEYPHIKERGTFVEADGIVRPAPAPRFSETPGGNAGPAVDSGEHTLEILTELLGNEQEAQSIIDKGIAHQE